TVSASTCDGCARVTGSLSPIGARSSPSCCLRAPPSLTRGGAGRSRCWYNGARSRSAPATGPDSIARCRDACLEADCAACSTRRGDRAEPLRRVERSARVAPRGAPCVGRASGARRGRRSRRVRPYAGRVRPGLDQGRARPAPRAGMSMDVASIKALTFDVFGTVVDWRSSLIREGETLGRAKGLKVSWTAFADAWRGLYQPMLEQVRSGAMPWTKLDDLHRMALDQLLVQFGVTGLTEAE